MQYQKPNKKNLFLNIWRSMSVSHRGLMLIFKESGTVHQLMPTEIVVGLILGIIVGFIPLEYIILAVIQVMILTTETLNSAVEEVCDLVTLENNKHVERAKDMGSGAVWIWHLMYIICTFGFFGMHLAHFAWWQHIFPG